MTTSPDWKMAVAESFATQSTCVRRQVGAALFWGDTFLRGSRNTEKAGLCETDCPRAHQSYEEQPAGVGYPANCAEHAERILLRNFHKILDGTEVMRRGFGLQASLEIVVTHRPCPERCASLVERAKQLAANRGETLVVRWKEDL